MYKVDQTIVYPAHGLAKIKRIENKTVGGKSKQFYVLSVVATDMTILVPVDQADTVGVRALVSKDKARQVAKYVKASIECVNGNAVKIDNTTWNRRYRDFIEKIKTGDIDEIAYVVIALKTIQKEKDLSFGERKMLDQASQLLHAEITLVLAE